MTIPAPRFDHLLRMTNERATFEHARFTEPRVEHGYCTDDMARVAVVAAREPEPSPGVARLLDVSVRFLVDAQGAQGGTRNRMDREGRWTDVPSFEDCWGRSVWGFGTVAARATDEAARESALFHFTRAAQGRSPWLRAMAFAALGAAEVAAAVDPGHKGARALLADAAERIAASPQPSWPWPEPELTYANGSIPEVLIAAGSLLERPELLARGLALLGWLLEHETLAGHFSVTPPGQRPGGRRPGFDQQPIEVAALADACARAATVDGDERWPRGVAAGVAWFLGDNDGGHLMWDATTGGAYDGLQEDGPNQNQGTESTLALLATLQHAQRPAAG